MLEMIVSHAFCTSEIHLDRALTLLSKYSRSYASPRPLIRPRNHSVEDAPIVPHGYGANSPFPTNVVVVRRVDMIGEEIQQFVHGVSAIMSVCFQCKKLTRFLFLQLRKPCYETSIHIQRLQTSNRVSANRRVMRINWWTIRTCSPKIQNGVVLQPGCMNSMEAVHKFLHSITKSIIQAILRHLCY